MHCNASEITATDHAQMLALTRRIIRKAAAIKSACVGRTVSASEATRDAEEIRILASMIEQRLGGEHA